MADDENINRDRGIFIQMDQPINASSANPVVLGNVRRSSLRPGLSTLPSGVVVNEFDEPSDQQEV